MKLIEADEVRGVVELYELVSSLWLELARLTWKPTVTTFLLIPSKFTTGLRFPEVRSNILLSSVFIVSSECVH